MEEQEKKDIIDQTKEEREIIEQLKSEHPIDEMVKFSEMDIMEKLKENSFQIVKYREHYYLEKSKLEKIEILYEKLLGLRYKFYKFEDDREWSKPEIEKYCLPSDPKILQMKKIMSKQKVRVRFFEIAYKGFEQAGWRMKTYMDGSKMGV